MGELDNAVRLMYERNKERISVDPVFLANGAMVIIKFRRELHPVGWDGCNFYCRQLARAFCRRNFDPTVAVEDYTTGEIFPETLQERYPHIRQRGEPTEYIIRAALSINDRWFNIDRMKDTAEALLKHADALEMETIMLFGPRPSAA